MRPRGLLCVLSLFGLCLAHAQNADVAPTELETFVSNPAATVVNDLLVDQIRSAESTIAISIIEAMDQWNLGETMRGARIDLSNNAWNDSVYLSEDQIADLALQLRMIARGLEEQREESHLRHNELLFGDRTIGTQQCWIGHPNQQRILCPSYRVVNGFETFSIQVNGSMVEVFPLATEHLVKLAHVVEAVKERLASEAAFTEEGIDDPPVAAEPSGAVGIESTNETATGENAVFESEPASVEDTPAPRNRRSIVLGGLLIAGLVAVFALVRAKWRTG